jgi:hypothetical protein
MAGQSSNSDIVPVDDTYGGFLELCLVLCFVRR